MLGYWVVAKEGLECVSADRWAIGVSGLKVTPLRRQVCPHLEPSLKGGLKGVTLRRAFLTMILLRGLKCYVADI